MNSIRGASPAQHERMGSLGRLRRCRLGRFRQTTPDTRRIRALGLGLKIMVALVVHRLLRCGSRVLGLGSAACPPEMAHGRIAETAPKGPVRETRHEHM